MDPEMMTGYGAEYRWLLSYDQTYGNAPSKDALLTKFPDFPITDYVDVAFAADEVRQLHNERMLKRAVRTASEYIREGDYEDAAMSIAAYVPSMRAKPLSNTLHDLTFLDSYTERVAAMEMPWRTLQRFTGGMRPGDLWYYAARTGEGKTWTLMSIIAKAVMDGYRVRMYSLEMPEEQIQIRMHVVLGNLLGVPVDHIKMRDRDFDQTAYRRLVNRIRDEVPGQLLVHDPSKGKVSPATVAAHGEDADLHVVDHIGLMSSPLGRRSVDDWRVLAAISNELKEVVTAKKTRVLAASQINREGDSVSKYPPKLKNLSGSDALGQDGDVVLTQKHYSKTSVIHSIEKNRHGDAGFHFYSRFQPNIGNLAEIHRDTADSLRDAEMD